MALVVTPVEPPAAEDLFDMVGDVELTVRRIDIACPRLGQEARRFAGRIEELGKAFQQVSVRFPSPANI